jgi:hypothetical protein
VSRRSGLRRRGLVERGHRLVDDRVGLFRGDVLEPGQVTLECGR